MNNQRDRYGYYMEIGRYLGVKINTANDLRKNLPPIPGIEVKDLRKLDDLQKILEYLEQYQ
ncbi:MAG: hypothetical protein ACK47Q_02250 [Dolichospermum sp.]|jgi:hypothetical protein